MDKSKPHAETRLAKFVAKRILEMRSKKSQHDIAVEAGFINPNVLSMIKGGTSKLPLDRVSGLAKALEVDAKYLFRLTLEQQGNETTALAIEQIFGTIVTQNEVAWLHEIREASSHADPSLTQRARAAVRGVFGK